MVFRWSVDMLAFAGDNPIPATIVLITGDGDFLYAVSTLRLRKYRLILLAPRMSSASLKFQATALYAWPQDILSTELPVPRLPAPATALHATVVGTSHTVSQPNSPRFTHIGLPPTPEISPVKTGRRASFAAHNKSGSIFSALRRKQSKTVCDSCL